MSEILLNWGVLDQMETGCRNMETLKSVKLVRLEANLEFKSVV